MSDILKEHEYEFEMATLDLKGQRFKDAEVKFMELVKTTKRGEAWCGLAAAKFGLLFNGSTVDEVFHCFNKARETGDNLTGLDTAVVTLAETTIRELHSLYVKAVLAQRKAQGRAIESAIMTGFSAIASVAEREKSQLASITYTATAAISFSNYITAKNTVQELEGFQGKSTTLILSIRAHVLGFIRKNPDEILLFNEVCEKLESETNQLILTDSERRNIAKENELQMQQDVKQKYIEDNRHIIDDTTNPFHKFKNDGVDFYKNKKYKAAIEQFDKAVLIYREDSEVNELRLKSVTKLLDNRVKIDFVIAAALLIIKYIFTGNFNNGDFVGAYVFCVLIVVIYRRVTKYYKYYPANFVTQVKR